MRRRRRSKRGGTTEEKLFGKIERKRKRRGRGKSWESPARFGKKIETVIQGAQVSWVQGRKLRNIGRNAEGGKWIECTAHRKSYFGIAKARRFSVAKATTVKGERSLLLTLFHPVSFHSSFLSCQKFIFSPGE